MPVYKYNSNGEHGNRPGGGHAGNERQAQTVHLDARVLSPMSCCVREAPS